MKKYLVPFLAGFLAITSSTSAYGMKKASDRDLEDASNDDSGAAQNSTVSRDENESETQSNIGRYSQDSQYSNESSTQPIMSQSSSQSREISPSNVYLFPRCEYYARFEGTSYFKMHESKYWHTYHRSEGTRFFNSFNAKKRENTQYRDGNLSISPKGHNSYFSHTGGYYNPYKRKSYADNVLKNDSLYQLDSDLYNKILIYKNKICEEVVCKCNELNKNPQLEKPIIYHHNDYPCIMVNMPFSICNDPEQQQYLIMSYFVAIVNDEAFNTKIPIELVLRSSFGHNLPSVDATAPSFRINVGIVPKKYTQVLADSLHKLFQLFQMLTNDKNLQHLKITQETQQRLKREIQDYIEYHKENYALNKEKYDEEIKKHKEMKDEEQEKTKKPRKPKEPALVDVKEHCWYSLGCAGDSSGKEIVSQFFREPYYVDLFANYIMEVINAGNKDFFNKVELAEKPIDRMFEHLTYKGKSASMNNTKDGIKTPLAVLKEQQRQKWNSDEDSELASDDWFWHLIEDISKGLNAHKDFEARKRKILGLYSFLEEINTRFITGSYTKDKTESGMGSSSATEAEGELKQEKLYAKKVIFPTGMMAVNAAYYCAQKFLKKDKPTACCNNMYYETDWKIGSAKGCLGLAQNSPSERKNGKCDVLFFDLNHCDSKNDGTTILLKAELKRTTPKAVVLDYASSTTQQVRQAIQESFQSGVELVLLVSSGLKNEQCGADNNPYGTLRIISRNKESCDNSYNLLRGLSQDHALSAQAHQIRKAYKARGFVPRNRDFLMDDYTAKKSNKEQEEEDKKNDSEGDDADDEEHKEGKQGDNRSSSSKQKRTNPTTQQGGQRQQNSLNTEQQPTESEIGTTSQKQLQQKSLWEELQEQFGEDDERYFHFLQEQWLQAEMEKSQILELGLGRPDYYVHQKENMLLPVKFREIIISGDGDCAFRALRYNENQNQDFSLVRNTQVKQVLSALENKGHPLYQEIKSDLEAEIKEAVFVMETNQYLNQGQDVPVGLYEETQGRILSDSDIKQYVQKTYSSKEARGRSEHIGYVRGKENTGKGMMAAIARIINKKIQIYTTKDIENEGSTDLQERKVGNLRLVFDVAPEEATETLYLHHTDTGELQKDLKDYRTNHFNALVLDQDQRQQKLFDSSSQSLEIVKTPLSSRELRLGLNEKLRNQEIYYSSTGVVFDTLHRDAESTNRLLSVPEAMRFPLLALNDNAPERRRASSLPFIGRIFHGSF